MKKSIILATTLTVALSGCASTMMEGKYDSRQWQRGEVVSAEGKTQTSTPVTVDCRKEASMNASTQFATVKYRHMNFWQTGIFPVAKGTPLANDDKVYVNAHDCSQPIAKQQPQK